MVSDKHIEYRFQQKTAQRILGKPVPFFDILCGGVWGTETDTVGQMYSKWVSILAVLGLHGIYRRPFSRDRMGTQNLTYRYIQMYICTATIPAFRWGWVRGHFSAQIRLQATFSPRPSPRCPKRGPRPLTKPRENPKTAHRSPKCGPKPPAEAPRATTALLSAPEASGGFRRLPEQFPYCF